MLLDIRQDEFAKNPYGPGEGAWAVASFNTKHTSFAHPDKFDNIGFKSKLRHGTAFNLSYHEHGDCIWRIGDPEAARGFDFVPKAGYIYAASSRYLPKGIEARRESASRAIAWYTEWCNGRCYRFSLLYPDGRESVDGYCLGFKELYEEVLSELNNACAKKVAFKNPATTLSELFASELAKLNAALAG